MNPTIVKMPDGTLKKFYGRKQVYLADKFVKENHGSKRLASTDKTLTSTPKVATRKIGKIILPDGKVLDSDGVHRGKYSFEFKFENGSKIVDKDDADMNHVSDALAYLLANNNT